MSRGQANREAKYAVIAADLEARIRSGEYPPGMALPPQRTLSSDYGVTLMTLRQALQVLAGKGLIIQRAGKDTLVSPPQASYRLDTLRSLSDDLRDQGHEVGTQVLGVALRATPRWVTTTLADDPRALRLERVRLVDGHPTVHQVSWVREPYASAIRDRDFSVTSLYDALADAGVTIDRATETIRPGLLKNRSAAVLGRRAGDPVLVSERVTIALDGTAVVADRASIVGDLMEIRTQRSTTQVSVHWARPAG